MTIRTLDLYPGLDRQTHQMVAEVLACVDADPEKRRDHRRQVLAQFPVEQQGRVRDITNRVIEARTRSQQQ